MQRQERLQHALSKKNGDTIKNGTSMELPVTGIVDVVNPLESRDTLPTTSNDHLTIAEFKDLTLFHIPRAINCNSDTAILVNSSTTSEATSSKKNNNPDSCVTCSSNCPCPVLLDLVEDRVRSRVLAVLSFMLIFCMVLLVVLSPALLDPYNRPQRVAATSVKKVAIVGAGASSRARSGKPLGFQPQVTLASPAELPLANRSVGATAALVTPTQLPLWKIDVVPGSLMAKKVCDK